MPRMAFMIIELILIAGIVLLGGGLVRKQLMEDDPGQTVEPAGNTATSAERAEPNSKPFDAYQNIALRDLFKTPKNEIPSRATLDIATLKPTELNLKLWGTITGEDGLTRAVIEDQTTHEQTFFRQGDEVASAKIKMILREKVVLSVNGEDQVLGIEQPSGMGGPALVSPVNQSVSLPATPLPDASPAPPPRSIRMKLSRLGPISDNPEDWNNDATVAPFVSDAGDSGLLINRLMPSSPLRRLGIRNGDVVVSINDQPVGELRDIFEPLMEMSEGKTLSLSFKRRGRDQQIDFLFE